MKARLQYSHLHALLACALFLASQVVAAVSCLPECQDEREALRGMAAMQLDDCCAPLPAVRAMDDGCTDCAVACCEQKPMVVQAMEDRPSSRLELVILESCSPVPLCGEWRAPGQTLAALLPLPPTPPIYVLSCSLLL